ncbi:hypothetical protein BR10RB9215_C20629 [Brucella sp. 10RB9215]|uniref:hypothetical protein n=1 Tax=Brucella sp. 10RB9215 TaxID=1149953 RepID=UPI00090A3DC2|nr:hypothetical protein [Brucella sp. 10RB9215]SBW15961.1 hypothetical protein BR10RB9215_C20629 [Brucella sp. 10RB9215]
MVRVEQTLEFSPTSIRTLRLLVAVYENTGEDPVEAFNALLSSTVVAAAIIQVDPEEFSKIVSQLLPVAVQAIKDNPRIFPIEYNDGSPANGVLQ